MFIWQLEIYISFDKTRRTTNKSRIYHHCFLFRYLLYLKITKTKYNYQIFSNDLTDCSKFLIHCQIYFVVFYSSMPFLTNQINFCGAILSF